MWTRSRSRTPWSGTRQRDLPAQESPHAALVVYNLLFLAAYGLAFMGAYLLARELGLGLLGAVVAGRRFRVRPVEASHRTAIFMCCRAAVSRWRSFS